MSSLSEIFLRAPTVTAAREALRAGSAARGLVLGRPAWPWTLAAIAGTDLPLVVVTPGDDEARDLARALGGLVGRGSVALLPTRGALAGGAVGPGPHIVGQRARAIASIGQHGRLVIAGVSALAERHVSVERRLEAVVLRVGESVDGDLVDRLVALGYERVDQVEGRGDLAVRGGIIDVFPSTADLPIRIERFGDEIEAMRAFSAFTQRAIRALDRALIWPAIEPAGGDLVDPLDDPGLGGACLVRLAPHEHPAALTAAAERLEDEAAAGALVDGEALAERIAAISRLDIALPIGGRTPDFDASEARFATRGLTEGGAELKRQAAAGRRVVVCFERRGDMERAARQLPDLRARILGDESDGPVAGVVSFVQLPVATGVISRELRLAIVPASAILRRSRRATSADRPMIGRHIQSFLDLRVGDHVVHVDHGIGRLTSFETRTVANVTRDYLAIAFAGSDRLFVPHDQLDRVTRYIGSDGTEPALSRLGGKAWDRMKSRARAAVHEMAGDLIALYEARSRAVGFAYPQDDELVAEFERAFPYRETPDQERAIDEVGEDMERARPMDRLICGDVGFGKTEVAMRAAFKATAAGKQVMVLVPTTILAQQHLATFRERMSEVAVSIDMVNRFRSPREVRNALARYRDGKLDILIGTHRLLGMDVQPRDLGLVVVDEEQRFGVAQKEALRRLRTTVDVLALSATPIPRTLQMSLSGLRDISVIETPPPGRRPIATHIGQYDEELVRSALLREAERGGQAFYLHNRVETIEEAAAHVRGLVPDLRVLVAHGQMPEHQLEDVMLAFIRGEGDVLVATTIIESGLDIPQANTLVVDRADRLGLSQLYQIRGRVGRSSVIAHAYLLYPDENALTHDAAARLRALADYTELGSGLKIAMRDLEIRGAGNLLGDEQSGHVAAVGFELYVEMLEEAVALRHGEVPHADVRIDLPVSAHIPSSFVPFEAAKIDLHRRIAHADSSDDLERLAAEVADRFGELPGPVEALLTIQRIKVGLRSIGVTHLAGRGTKLSLAPILLGAAQVAALRDRVPRLTYVSIDRTVSVSTGADPAERLATALEVTEALESLLAPLEAPVVAPA